MAHSHLDGLVLEDTISQAFAGVCLNGGISLRQAQIIDKRDDALSDKDFDNLPAKEITDDWSQIPLSELDRDCIAHLDEKGFLYYIPALMLSVLHNYDASSMRVIGHFTRCTRSLCTKNTTSAFSYF
jgi:hypothetical protein